MSRDSCDLSNLDVPNGTSPKPTMIESLMGRSIFTQTAGEHKSSDKIGNRLLRFQRFRHVHIQYSRFNHYRSFTVLISWLN